MTRTGLLRHNAEGRAISLHYAGSLNMPRLVALKGPKGSGKSKTLIQVYEELIAKFPAAKNQFCPWSKDRRNICAVLNIKGKTIGIESNNHDGHTARSLKLFLNKRCDVFVCATSTRGISVEAVKSRFAERKITWLDLPKPASESAKKKARRAMADKIFRKVYAIVR